MSVHMVEKALLDIAASRASAEAYLKSPDDYLDAYRLDAGEIVMIKQLDVLEMQKRGLNPMLTMRAFSAIEGREKMPEYMRQLREN